MHNILMEQKSLFVEDNDRGLKVPEEREVFTFEFEIKPKAIQSVKFRIVKPKFKKQFVSTYQPKENLVFKEFFTKEALIQRNRLEKYKILEGAVGIEITYIHQFRSDHTKKQKAFVGNGGILWKTTNPDMTDNLQKGWIDALKGILWNDDGQICHMEDVRKIYGPENLIILKVWEIVQEK